MNSPRDGAGTALFFSPSRHPREFFCVNIILDRLRAPFLAAGAPSECDARHIVSKL